MGTLAGPQIDPRIDAYIARAEPFARPILERLREDVHRACPDVVETLKWGMPTFMRGARILAHLAAFKAHCAFGFWHGDAVVSTGREAQAMGQFGRITSLEDLPTRTEQKALVKKAAALIDAGVKPPRAPKSAPKSGPKPPLETPPDLAAALAHTPAAKRTYEALASGHQREYVAWITEAKREATRARRIEQTVAWLAEGKRRNWKYEPC